MPSGYYPKVAINKPQSGVALKVTTKTDRTPTNAVLEPMPEIFNILGIGGNNLEFKISLSFESHPSGSFSFLAQAKDKIKIQETLKIGTEFDAFSLPWRITNISIAETTSTDQPIRPIAINISLGGKYENYLNLPLALLKTSVDPFKGIDPDCLGQTKPEYKQKLDKSMTVQRLASRAGTSFSGAGNWRFDISYETDPKDSTTLETKLKSLQFSNKTFLIYSNPKAIKAKTVNSVRKWKVGEDIIIGSVTSTIRGKKPSYNGSLIVEKSFNFKLDPTKKLPSAKIEPDNLPLQKEDPPTLVAYFWPRHKLNNSFIQKETIIEEPIKGDKKRWRRRSPKKETIIEDADNAEEPPGNGRAEDVSQNFDQSGPQKVWKQVEYVDGVEVASKIKVYGYAFTGANSAVWNENSSSWETTSVSGTWKVVKSTKTVHDFEREYGFHLGYETTGFSLQRLKQESTGVPETAIYYSLVEKELNSKNIGKLLGEVDAEEALQLPEEDLRAALGQIAGAFEFKKVKFIEEEAKYLEPEKRYFKDSNIPFRIEDVRKVCLPNGRPEWIIDRADPYLAPTYFASLIQIFKSSYLSEINPEWSLQTQINTVLAFTPEEQQDRAIVTKLVTGEISLEETKTIVEPEAKFHTVYTSSYASKGPGFNQKLQQTTLERREGRPESNLLRLPSVFYREEEEDDKNKEKKAEEPKIFEHWVESAGITNPDKYLTGGSLEYEGCDTVAKAKKAAEFDLWRRNVTSLGTKEITIAYTNETKMIREGDIIDLTVNNIIGEYRVTGIDFTIKLQGKINDTNLVTCDGIKLTLVPEPKISLKYSKQKPLQTKMASKTDDDITMFQSTTLKDKHRKLKYTDKITSRIKPPSRQKA